MTVPRLSRAQQECLVALAARPDEWLSPCRSDETLRVLNRRGFVVTRTKHPGRRLQAKIVARGLVVAKELAR